MTSTATHPADMATLDDFRTLTAGIRSHAPITDREVSDELIADVYEALRWAPTAFNSSPLRLMLARTPEAREQLTSLVSAGNRDRVATAPLAIVAATDVNFHETLDVVAPHLIDAPVAKPESSAMREAVAEQSGNIQLGYLMLALRAAGLSVGPMTGIDKPGINKTFFADTGWQALAVLTVGYPSGDEVGRERNGRLDPADVIQVR